MHLETLYQQQTLTQLITLRRHLHQIPQIGLMQYQTSKFVRQYLAKVEGVVLIDTVPQVQTAVIANILVEEAKEHYLFRCELDALAWEEKSGEHFSSKNGLHHACGHDAHMAVMLMTCKKIAQHRSSLKRSITFCFQPGQQGKGGAYKLIQNHPKLLEGITHSFALHSANHLAAGQAAVSPGIISANSNMFSITVQGKGCHVMIPENGIDANFIACSLVTQLYALKQQRMSPSEQGTLCVTQIKGGIGGAMISEKCQIKGSLRMLSLKSHLKMLQQIQKLSVGYCESLNAKCQVKITASHYRSVQNHATPTKIVRKILQKILPQQFIKQQIPAYNGQDFCQLSQRVPSCYFILGAGLADSFNENHQSLYPLHSNRHKLDEKFMLLGVKIWEELAFS